MILQSLMAGRQWGPCLSPALDLKAITTVRTLGFRGQSAILWIGRSSGVQDGWMETYLPPQLDLAADLFLTKISKVRVWYLSTLVVR